MKQLNGGGAEFISETASITTGAYGNTKFTVGRFVTDCSIALTDGYTGLGIVKHYKDSNGKIQSAVQHYFHPNNNRFEQLPANTAFNMTTLYFVP